MMRAMSALPMKSARSDALLAGALRVQHIAIRRPGSSGVAAAVAILLLSHGAAAAPNYPVADGPGLATCQQAAHLEHENPALADGFFAWAEGFMSGLNDRYVASNAAADLLPPNLSQQQQKDFLAAFCAAHPDEPYMQGVWALYLQMRREQKLP
jgi:hypothetical protein